MAGTDTRRLYAARTETNLRDTVRIVGSFQLNGDDAAPTAVRGQGFTVVHSGDNDYLITFSERYPQCVAAKFSFVASAAGDTGADDLTACREPYLFATGSCVVRVASGGTKSDLADGERLEFEFVFHKRMTEAVEVD